MRAQSWVRRCIPPAARAAVRDRLSWARELEDRARVWRWTVALVRGAPFDVVYVGRDASRAMSCELVTDPHAVVGGALEASRALLAAGAPALAELPLPGAVRAVSWVRSVLPADPGCLRLRARQRALAAECTVVPVTDEGAVERVFREMLEPFAAARHGARAVQLELSTVKLIARTGRLDVVVQGGEEVAASLGYPLERGGERYWVGARAGYPERVFSDRRRFADTNLVNVWLGLKRARESGFDRYDLGISHARADDGVLQWKRQMGASVDTWGLHRRVWVRPPRGGAARFFWASPVFGAEPRGLVLHVGVPAALRPEEAAARFARLHFGGLAAVRAHADPEVGASAARELLGAWTVPVEVTR